jgi:hypothetical protein
VTEVGLFDAIYSALALRRLKPDAVHDEVITRIACAPLGARAHSMRAPTNVCHSSLMVTT